MFHIPINVVANHLLPFDLTKTIMFDEYKALISPLCIFFRNFENTLLFVLTISAQSSSQIPLKCDLRLQRDEAKLTSINIVLYVLIFKISYKMPYIFDWVGK